MTDLRKTVADALPEMLAKALPGIPDKPPVTYRLHRDEHVPDGIRRIAREQLRRAHDELSGSGRKPGKAVHETRKRLKRLRACVRLSREAIGDETYRRENTAFRTAGRELAAGRDAQVLLDTLDALGERFGDELPASATARLRDRLVAQREATMPGEDDPSIAVVLTTLEQATARTPAWTFADGDFDALSPGLRRIYRRGRKRMRVAAKDPSPENLHEWRKRVKDLWHTTQIVREAHPERLGRFAKRAHKLADVLGDGHDLSVLHDYALAHPRCFADDASKQALFAVIDRRSEALRDKALKRGRKLYEPSPKRFVKRIERGWHERAADRPRPVAD